METILEEAQRLVLGDRGESYGHPIEDFTRTGQIWGAILGTDPVPPEKVALMMIGVKISREVNASKRDNRTDIAGYAQTLQMVRERQEEPASPAPPLMETPSGIVHDFGSGCNDFCCTTYRGER
jgi:hypothetical protein